MENVEIERDTAMYIIKTYAFTGTFDYFNLNYTNFSSITATGSTIQKYYPEILTDHF